MRRAELPGALLPVRLTLPETPKLPHLGWRRAYDTEAFFRTRRAKSMKTREDIESFLIS